MLSRLRNGMCLVVISGIMLAMIHAQEGLPKKPYTEWSREEATKVLNASSWAMQQEVRIKFDKEVQKAAGSYSGVSGTAAAQAQTEVTTQMPVDFIFTLRLRSAVPVRQAIVRLKTLDTDFEKMTSEQMGAFDKLAKGLLECPACAGNYVVTLSSRSKNSPGADAVFTVLKGARMSDLQRYVFIANESGERRQLAHFVAPKAPGDEATFFFSRFDDKGEPLLRTDNKELMINLNDNKPNSISNFRIDVKNIIVNGKIEF